MSPADELRINDGRHAWRLIYHVAADAVVVLDVFSKQTQTTPRGRIAACRKRLRAFQQACTGEE